MMHEDFETRNYTHLIQLLLPPAFTISETFSARSALFGKGGILPPQPNLSNQATSLSATAGSGYVVWGVVCRADRVRNSSQKAIYRASTPG